MLRFPLTPGRLVRYTPWCVLSRRLDLVSHHVSQEEYHASRQSHTDEALD